MEAFTLFYRAMHNRGLRLLVALLGAALASSAVNIFIVPHGLYTGGLLGMCQVGRTLLQNALGFTFSGGDPAGVIYMLANIPLLFLAFRSLGKEMAVNTLICTVAYSVLYAVIPVPARPVITDRLTACLLGGILAGVGNGIVLTCGYSGGGLDVLGLYLSKKRGFTVGKFNLTFNFFLYAVCLLLFPPTVVIYSVIFNFFSAMVLDRVHQQNITVQALIFTKEKDLALPRFIMERMGRGVTAWDAVGGYTGDEIRVLCVCLSKYEIEELRHAVHEMDPHAFFIIQQGVTVDGNFIKKLNG